MKEKLLSTKKNTAMHLNNFKLAGCKTPRMLIIGHLNVNSLKNKIIAVEEFMRNKLHNFFFEK